MGDQLEDPHLQVLRDHASPAELEAKLQGLDKVLRERRNRDFLIALVGAALKAATLVGGAAVALKAMWNAFRGGQ